MVDTRLGIDKRPDISLIFSDTVIEEHGTEKWSMRGGDNNHGTSGSSE